MKKFFLTISLFAMTLMAVAQEPALKARSIYDVNQDDNVSVADVPSLVRRLSGSAEDKTAVDTQSLLKVLGTLTESINSLKAQIATIQQQLGLEPGTEKLSHAYVDLGLPGGVKWATCNVGAENPEDAGLFFAWGEVDGFDPNDASNTRVFSWSSYKWMTAGQSSQSYCTKYTCQDGKTTSSWYSKGVYVGSVVNGKTYTNQTVLLPEDDAATQSWGDDWCIPTPQQFADLVNATYTTTSYEAQNGVMGLKITSKSNGNSIFLPAPGFRYNSGTMLKGTYGGYWSSQISASASYNATSFVFGQSTPVDAKNTDYRYYGQSIRPVRR
ncbi:MAG: hypothetical protein MJZ60_04385 [Bacteroidaceae bacterium]|nr:hypothetical protein [Bacteroidaceae bacterium]